MLLKSKNVCNNSISNMMCLLYLCFWNEINYNKTDPMNESLTKGERKCSQFSLQGFVRSDMRIGGIRIPLIWYKRGTSLMGERFKTLSLTACSRSLLHVVRIRAWICHKVASDLGLGGSFRWVLRFPPLLTTGQSRNSHHWHKCDEKRNSKTHYYQASHSSM